MPVARVSARKAATLFGAFTIYFVVLLHTLLPFLKGTFRLNPALYWFITGYVLFIPMFVYSIAAARKELVFAGK